MGKKRISDGIKDPYSLHSNEKGPALREKMGKIKRRVLLL
jgi:hypothetical protein